ncbi:hypothetical protein ACWD5Q_14070 [Streptomyces sp. NPDC002513]
MDNAAATAVQEGADIDDGASLAVGGSGLSGIPDTHIRAPDSR